MTEAPSPKSLFTRRALALAGLFNLGLVGLSQLSLTVDLSPVPITGQTLGVLLTSMLLGPGLGTLVVAAYLLEGALGLPVFAGGAGGLEKLLGPSGGFLLSFVPAAYLTGRLARRVKPPILLKNLGIMTLGTLLIMAGGLAWLARFVASGELLEVGLIPFLPGAGIKVVIGAGVVSLVSKLKKQNRQ